MTSIMNKFFADIERRHHEEVANGEHDAQCEFLRRPGFYLCHCSKRRREAAGHTEPPELEFVPPICLRCGTEVEVEAEGFSCGTCSATWDFDGQNAQFTDDYGDLSEEGDRNAGLQPATQSAPTVVDVQLPEPAEAVPGA